MNLNYSFFPMNLSALDAKQKAERQTFWQQIAAKTPASHHLPRFGVEQGATRILQQRLLEQQSEILMATSQQQGASSLVGVLALVHGLLSRYSNETAQSIAVLQASENRMQQVLLVMDEAPLTSFALATKYIEQQMQQLSQHWLAEPDWPVELQHAMQQTKVAVILTEQQPDDSQLSAWFSQHSLQLALVIHQDINAENTTPSIYWCAESSLFNQTALRLFAQHFANLAAAISAQPELDLGQYPIVTESEIARWNALNNHNLAITQDACLASLFEQQAQQTPENVAVVTQYTQINYQALNDLANQVAHFLTTQIVQSQQESSVIGVCLPRSITMIAVILAIHKVGAAYLPLDPNYPSDRLRYMAANGQVCGVVCSTQTADIFADSQQIVLDIEAERLAQQDIHSLAAKVSGFSTENIVRENLAAQATRLSHVIYTSGSTGKPKGVAVRHSNALAMLSWAQSAFSVEELSKVLFSTSLNFDLSVFELFVPLCFGHQCFVVENLLQLLEWSAPVSLINTVPSAAQSIFAQQRIPETVLTVNLAGEPLSAALVNDLLTKSSCSSVCNLYGPSEDTTYSTYARFNQTVSSVPSIGFVLPNSQALLLSPTGQRVPDGVEAELYLAGAGVAAGYLHNPELTAERFVPNPYHQSENPQSTSVMYKTGDKVRREADGSLSFLGRFDFQVKVRGFRIELGEIEHELRHLPQVQDALVSVIGEGSQARLVAYVTTVSTIEEPATWQAVALQQLGKTLPEYMLPDVFVLLPEFPRLPNGKVDRNQLPEPVMALIQTEYRAPRNEIEQGLCEIWQELLQVERVGIDDNFFQLGGNSLIAVQMSAKCREKLQKQVTLPLLFQHKTIAVLAGQLSRLEQDIVAANTDNYPLSFAQERMWFIEQLTGQQSAYHIPTLIALQPEADPQRLLAAVSAVIQRHPVLTARYHEDDNGELRQIYHRVEHSDFVYPEISVADQPSLHKKIKQLTAQGFDFKNEASVRVYPITAESNTRYLFILWHHMVFDGWSEGAFFNEVAQVYQQQTLAPIEVCYGDYALWQRQRLQGDLLTEQQTFWREYLQDYQDLSLATDYPRPATFDYAGDMVSVEIPSPLWAQLQQTAKQQQTTLYTLLLSGYYLLLSGFSGQQDIVIGTASDNRDQGNVQELVGLFVNSLAIRQQIESTSSISTFIQQLHSNLVKVKQFQELPFDQVVDLLSVQRDLSRSPIFQAMFTMQGEHVSTQGLPIAFIPQLQADIAKFDLNLMVEELASGPVAQFSFARSVFAKSRVQQWADAYIRVLQQLMQCEYLHEITVLEPEQLARLQQGGYQHRFYSDTKHLAQLFQQTVASDGQKIAVISANESISFAQLDERSNQVAQQLLQAGFSEQNAFVGICLPREVDLLVAIVGALKAGAAFVPLDPNYPCSRLQYIHDDAALSCVICDETTQALVGEFATNTCSMAQVRGASKQPVTVDYRATDVAYVIYTSGSTGQPKGVMIEQASACNLAHVLQELDLGASDPVSQSSSMQSYKANAWGWLGSVAFDGSIKGITQLLQGQTLSIFTEQEKQDIQQVMARLPELSVIDGTPALIELWLDSPLAPHLPNIVLGGEAISESLWQRLVAWQVQTGKRVYNMYGPTECTVNTSYSRVAGETPNIGHTLPNVCAYVMNEQQQLLPIDTVGELVIGGAGVARGYIGLPEMTAERFIDNPFYQPNDPHSHPTLYRSGDRVKRLANGNLVFVGRNDDQVKVSGYRIELGEVSSALNACALVAQGTVVVDKPGSRLLAYVVFDGNASEALSDSQKIQQITAQLQAQLPNYMVPARIIALPKLPLTVNGKIDKSALPIAEQLVTDTVYRAPSTQQEQALCAIWQQVLHVSKVGVDDNFFQLGGNSLAAVKVGILCRHRLGLDLPLPLLFEHKTIAQLQGHLVNNQQLITGLNHKEYPLSFAQERMWFIQEFDDQASAYHIPYLLKLDQSVNLNQLLAAIATVLHRHSVTTGRFSIDEQGQVQQSVVDCHSCDPTHTSENSVFAPLMHLSNLAEIEAEALRLASQAFDLVKQAGVKVFPMQDNETTQFVFLLWHHLIFDGWSQQLFFNEVSAVYSGKTLPELSLHYGDYALWQREVLQGEQANSHKHYWQQTLADFSPLTLPADFKRPAEFDYQGDIVETEIDAQLWAELEIFAKQQETTLYTVMLSGFFLLLHGFSGQDDIVVGTASDNRDEGGVADLIGLFVNSLAIRQQIDDQQAVKGFVAQVHQGVLAAKRHQQLPFEQVIDLLDIDRDLSRSPLFQVMFTMQDSFAMPADLPAELVSFVQDDIAKFDLNLFIKPTATGAIASFNFARSIYAKSRVQQWAKAYTQVLRELLDAECVNDVSVVASDERQQLLKQWHRSVSFGGEQHLGERFVRTVREHHGKTALITANQRLNFEELNARANQVAHYLIAQGIAKNNGFVGVCLPRSIDFLVAIIGIWKAGAAYVPLDPTSPISRLRYIHQNAQLACVISNEQQLDLAQSITSHSITLTQMQQHSCHDVLVSSKATDIAYVIYTSGSTGKPKGVLIEHCSAINLGHALRELDFHQDGKSWGWLANVAFDGSVQGISQLLFGQSLSIISDDEKQDLEALLPRLSEISVMDITPALVEVWIDTELQAHLPNLLIGGEAISEQLWQRLVTWQTQSGNRVYNEYGPTEITVVCTFQLVTGDVPAIGLSLPNTSAYVMNEQQQLLPFDTIGELVIGGAGVARGYIDLPEMTAERFIDNPFYDENDLCSSPKLYRSGDRVKRLRSGELVFCGRNDDQVKVRGYRIELDEVSAGLNASQLSQEQVRDLLTILVKHGATGDATLVSFYIPKDDAVAANSEAAEQQAQQLLQAAQAFLPDFMLPTRLIALPEFPITPNGKVDKARLPIPDFSARQTDYVAPETELQQQVSALFTQLLGVEKPSIHDNFFALGGHSLIATKLSNLVTVQFNVPLRVKDIFLSPTVATISARIETLQTDAAEPQVEQRVTKFHEDDAFDMDTFEL